MQSESSTRTALLSEQIPVCRICLEEDGPAEMVRPCRCSGTQGKVHRRCMKEWLNASGKKRCEICKWEFGIRRRRLRPVQEWSLPKPASEMFEDQIEFVCLIVWILFQFRIVYAICSQGPIQMHQDLCRTFESSRMAFIWWISLIFNTYYYAQSVSVIFQKWVDDNTETDWYFDRHPDEKSVKSIKLG
ncbi:unnamed protein product [Bursaphelenchus xylophilus]|uniref:(pine wood nematode) hypothetical protein n=1 Tax=Bursaphelenchus xylophilus TaxID=6326 RepID=A0A1I7RJG3_BURXY|nr:unnamed protein product [Bursaphelenchus xylophilus]CAG9128867.1 unnamed protein product [Bursaphelenchus xylophilus]